MKSDRFSYHSDIVAGVWVKFQGAICGVCGTHDRVKDASRNGLPPEAVKKKFAQKGWEMGQRPNDDTCPKCTTKRVMSRKQAAFLAIKRKEEQAMQSAIATPPREPTQTDRVKIRQALFEHYDEGPDGPRYLGSWSDRALGEHLKVPWAWVKTMREAMALGPDENEAGGQWNAAVGELKQEAATLEEMLASLKKKISEVERGGWKKQPG